MKNKEETINLDSYMIPQTTLDELEDGYKILIEIHQELFNAHLDNIE